jgi:hypothetical protein
MTPKVPVVVFATMRRSGSHFLMHRSLASISLVGPMEFGAHINSIGCGKLRTQAGIADPAKVMAYRKQNHFYTDEPRPSPRTGNESVYVDATYAWMSGVERSFDLNPSDLRMKFLAINIEDETIDFVAEKARSILSAMPPFFETYDSLPVFVTLRSLRSIALSRKKWLETKGEKNIMAEGFRKLDTEVWADHYQSSIAGKSKGGVSVVGLHYREGVESKGASVLRDFRAATTGQIKTHEAVPNWITGSVLSDGHGSSFVGSGINKASAVEKSLEDRAPMLDQFSHLFDQCPSAKEHAERFGEL